MRHVVLDPASGHWHDQATGKPFPTPTPQGRSGRPRQVQPLAQLDVGDQYEDPKTGKLMTVQEIVQHPSGFIIVRAVG